MSKTPPRWVQRLGRIGYAAKGVIYLSIGLLSAAAATAGGRARDSRDILQTVAAQPFGTAMLGVLTAGIGCYVIWRLALAFAPGRKAGLESLLPRAQALLSAAIYTGLGLAALATLRGARSSSGGGEDSARDGTAQLMAVPFGKWLVVLVGVGLIVYGISQWRRVWKGSFEKRLALSSLAAPTRRWIIRICGAGISARGIAFCLIGLFLAQAGLHANPAEARGLAGALSSLSSQPHGPWLLGAVALGLAAYGIYCGVKARFGEIA